MKTSKLKQLSCVLVSSLILAGSITLTGCINNSGDDGDNSRAGNNSYYIKPIKLNIINAEQTVFTKIIVTDKQNKEILNQNFVCAPGATCPFAFNERLQAPITLKFYNQNKLITTYTIVDLAGNFGKIETSDVMLGTYIYKQIKTKDKELATTLNSKLDTFFDCYCSPDKRPDNFEELGLYYKAMVVQGKQTDAEFYTKLIADLNANKKLPGGSFSKRKKQQTELKSLVVNSTQAQLKSANGSSCSQYTSGIMTAFSALKLFPIPGISVFDFADRVVDGACDSFEGDVLNGLDEIKNKLNEMDAKLDAIGYQIQELADKMDHQNLSRNISEINNKIEEWSALRDSYYQILNGGHYKNFSEFLQKNGNVAGIMQKDGSAKVLLTSQLKNFNSFYNQINETNRLDSIRGSLVSLCGTAEKIHEDIITRRFQCNLIASDMIAKLTSTAQEEKIILSDISSAIMKDPGYQDILKDSSILPPLGKSWENVDSNVLQQQEDKLKVVQAKFASNGIPFLPYQGLSEELQKNIAAVGCNYKDTDVPDITYWKAAVDKSKPWNTYIGVVCKTNDREHVKEVNSEYGYLTENDNNVRNVLGVLVSDNYLNKAWNRPSENFYLMSNADTLKISVGIYLAGFDGRRLYFNSDTNNNFSTRITNASLYNDPLRWLDDKGMLFSDVRAHGDNNHSNYYLVPIAYTDEKGLTHTFGLKYEAYNPSEIYSDNQLKARLTCLTSDCQEDTPRNPNYTKLRFNSGLNVMIDGGGEAVTGRRYLHIW